VNYVDFKMHGATIKINALCTPYPLSRILTQKSLECSSVCRTLTSKRQRERERDLFSDVAKSGNKNVKSMLRVEKACCRMH